MGESLQSKKSFACSFFDCKAAFSKSWKLEAHICKHTGLKPFSCDSCDKSFCTRYQLTRHELTHSGEKPHKCLAEGCSEAFVTNPSMKNHMSQVHQKEKRYRVATALTLLFLTDKMVQRLTLTLCFSASILAVERTSTRRTNSTLTCMSTLRL